MNTRALTKRNYVYRSKSGRTAKSSSNPAEKYKRARLEIAIAETQQESTQSIASSEPPLLLQVKRGRGRPRLIERRKINRKKEGREK